MHINIRQIPGVYIWSKILFDLPDNTSPLLIFENTTNFNELIRPYLWSKKPEWYSKWTWVYINSREDPCIDRDKLWLCLHMFTSKLPNLKCYWHVDNYPCSERIRNVMTRTRFMSILQNIDFADNKTADKSDKAYKLCSAIDNLNAAFQAGMSDGERQSINEYMAKFKGPMFCKQ